MMRSAVWVLALVAVVLVVTVGAERVLGESEDVHGTPHDLAAPGDSPCVYCHLPREDGGEILWARDPSAGGPLAGMKTLCFSCHDGTVTWEGMYAFSTDRTMHVTDSGVRGQDCDLCHDPHGADNNRFVKVAGNANFCRSCHQDAGPDDHPVDVDARATGVEPEDGTWDPDHGDFSGTRLWNSEGTAPGTFVKCLSCHATHGGVPGTEFNSMPFESSHEAFLPLCLNCHFGWGRE